ncbi:mRNA 3'-end-processing protein RNA14-like isoform X2 [Bufo gargarizans]|uniref:mRNA 3'-end-processing protein RNA14-like isoform X2 n=1 Tax=Bufo gargarizans TaxID=30331 RepID=UPI001CF1833F|nr:mRNA 3'-end-processing protein RNA14-like isoform X2 [Bufo gargarizans]
MASCAVESSMELSAELIGRDGSSRPFRVTCEGTLRGVLGGLERLQGEVSAELSRLVEREKAAGGARGPDNVDKEEDDDEEEEEEDDDDDDSSSKNGSLSSSPLAKRTKTLQR